LEAVLMIRCNNCGTNNIDGSEYCDECGMRLDSVPPALKRGRVEPPIYQPPSAVEPDPVMSNTVEGPPPTPPSFTTSTSIPKPAMPARERRHESRGGDITGQPKRSSETDEHSVFSFKPQERQQPEEARPSPPGQPQTYALSSRPHTEPIEQQNPGREALSPLVTAKLFIERGGRIGREFPITGVETNIGRWDADSGIFPDVDLDEDDPEAKISRRHARIINHSGQYYIEDLGSTNGTFVNRGRRLLPGKRHMLQNGDEIIVGKTFLKFQILR
jgi:hypothetical protein